MAESLQFGRSLDISSDHVPEHYCESCFEIHDAVKPVTGYCQNCDQELCFDCFSTHLKRKPFRNHKLVDKSTRPKTSTAPQTNPGHTGEECHLHPGEILLSFCHSHSQCCCQVCLTIHHQDCHTEDISKLSRNVQNSQELDILNKKLSTLKKGFQDNISKPGANETVIQKNHSQAIKDMKKLQDEINKQMADTEAQADQVKEEDFQKIEKVVAHCDIVIKQIDKLSNNLDTLNRNGEQDNLFISMKRVESQLTSFEENLDKIDKDNTVREYKFEPDEKLAALLNNLKVLGHLSFVISQPTGRQQHSLALSLSDQKTKKPTYVKDITVKSTSEKNFIIYDSVVLSNKQIVITDWHNQKIKLIDTNQDSIVSEIQVSGSPFGITKVKDDEVALTIATTNTIQFVSVSQHSLSTVREMSVNGKCRGIAYNAKDKTLIVVYIAPGKVEILNMTGHVIKILHNDSKGNKLDKPCRVAIHPDMTCMYITTRDKDTVTLMTLNGEVRAVYKDSSLQCIQGICVHNSGLVYVVGSTSNTVHQLDPDSGEFKLLLENQDGISNPYSISYCELENKMYIGMFRNTSVLKVFQMK